MNVTVWLFPPSSEENPFDIDEKAMAQDEKEDGQKDGGEEAEEGGEKMEEDQADQPGEENDQEPKTEEGEKDKEEEEGGGEKAEGDEECAEKDEEEEKGQEAGRDENLTIPNDKGPKPKVCVKELLYPFDEHRRCPHTWFRSVCHLLGLSNAYRRRRRKEQARMRSSPRQPRGRSTTQTVRPESRAFRATQLWSWQERRRRETKPKRYAPPRGGASGLQGFHLTQEGGGVFEPSGLDMKKML